MSDIILIKAKCVGCYKSSRREWRWSNTFRKIDKKLLKNIKEQKNHKGEKCFFDIKTTYKDEIDYIKI